MQLTTTHVASTGHSRRQVSGKGAFFVDILLRETPRHVVAESTCTSGSASTISEWLASGSQAFSDRFRQTFQLEEKGFSASDVRAAKAALSNMLGGMGYFVGSPEVRGAGDDGGNARSFRAELFTAVPSRSFFPRGFLWDEGFHQVPLASPTRPGGCLWQATAAVRCSPRRRVHDYRLG